MRNTVIRPHTLKGRVCCNKMQGRGVSFPLLNGSSGPAGTLTNDAPSIHSMSQTGMAGGSLGKTIAAKLGNLKLQTKKKPENIRFSI